MRPVHWIPILVILAAIVVLLALKWVGSMSPGAASEYLRQGAKLIDVRTVEEFRARHLPRAINIPLADLKQQISHHVPHKEHVVLLHCLSGGRSGLGRRVLKRMGYTRVFNLGSYRRAERAVREAEQ